MVKIIQREIKVSFPSPNYSLSRSAKLSLKLKDWNGNNVKLGDLVCVELPIQEVGIGYMQEQIKLTAAKHMYGILKMTISSGLLVEVNLIISHVHDEEDYDYSGLKKLKLKYTKYKWYKVDKLPDYENPELINQTKN